MFDVIAKTLPADPAERAALEEAEAFMRAQDARLQDATLLDWAAALAVALAVGFIAGNWS